MIPPYLRRPTRAAPAPAPSGPVVMRRCDHCQVAGTETDCWICGTPMIDVGYLPAHWACGDHGFIRGGKWVPA